MVDKSPSHNIILQLIADILSFRPNCMQLQQLLHPTKTNWDAIVEVASQHLVLPTIYHRLQQKELLHLLPEDLHLYLKEITTINRNRNLTLKEEIEAISKLFQTHGVDHVFFKGAALLTGHYYKDFGERMIGDIDILIGPNHIKKAFDLLVSEGYCEVVKFNYEDANYRHLPRQVCPDKLAAIELHKNVLNKKYSYLVETNTVLENKICIDGIFIPSIDDLIQTTILGHQINNRGNYYNTLNLKHAYDCLVLQLEANINLLKKLSKEKYCSNFLGLMAVHFPEIEISHLSLKIKVNRFFYRMSLKYSGLRTILQKMKHIAHSIVSRISLIIFNKSYRRHILSNKIFKSE